VELPTQAWSAHCRRLTDERAAGWLSAAAYDALQALAALVAQGNPTPSVRQIAAMAHVSARTVQRARRVAEDRGLLAVEARFEVVDHRPRQQENRYELRTPAEPVRPRPRRQSVTPRVQGKKEVLRKAVDNLPFVDLLAARRAVIEARMLR
jgi:DNA-binding transcriptional MocR family regulator